MKTAHALLVVALAMLAPALPAEADSIALDNLVPVGVLLQPARAGRANSIRVVKNASITEFDEPTFAKARGLQFRDGVIEVEVRSQFLEGAPDFARGFIGVAFRISEDDSKFECIYLRPDNARVPDQLRRNRSVQYFSYPDYKFQRLRKEFPGMYESYVDMGMGEWIAIRIDVRGDQAQLFVNDSKHPVLVVRDLKHGPASAGSVGLWVDVGTEGFFRNLKVSQR